MDGELTVVGAGLGRTGTASLQLALERLLGGKCYHMKELLQKPTDIYKWIKAGEQGLSDKEWRELFSKYRATVDFPGVPFYRDILRVYPKAKVILSVRDAKAWVKSCKGTILSPELAGNVNRNIVFWFSPLRRFGSLRKLMFQPCFGDNFDITNEDSSIQAFNKWNESVKSAIPSDQLLIFEAKDGWQPLCDFLGLPVPDEPYPHVNSTDEFQKKVKYINRFSKFAVLGTSLAIAGIAFVVYRMLKK